MGCVLLDDGSDFVALPKPISTFCPWKIDFLMPSFGRMTVTENSFPTCAFFGTVTCSGNGDWAVAFFTRLTVLPALFLINLSVQTLRKNKTPPFLHP